MTQRGLVREQWWLWESGERTCALKTTEMWTFKNPLLFNKMHLQDGFDYVGAAAECDAPVKKLSPTLGILICNSLKPVVASPQIPPKILCWVGPLFRATALKPGRRQRPFHTSFSKWLGGKKMTCSHCTGSSKMWLYHSDVFKWPLPPTAQKSSQDAA